MDDWVNLDKITRHFFLAKEGVYSLKSLLSFIRITVLSLSSYFTLHPSWLQFVFVKGCD